MERNREREIEREREREREREYLSLFECVSVIMCTYMFVQEGLSVRDGPKRTRLERGGGIGKYDQLA